MNEIIHEQAREIAAQCWCDPETEDRVMDPVLAEAFAKRLEIWMESAQQEMANRDFYRNLLDRCALHLGPEVYLSKDGSVQDEPVRLLIPELIEKLAGGARLTHEPPTATRMSTEKMRVASHLLPDPAGEVVRECLSEIDRLSLHTLAAVSQRDEARDASRQILNGFRGGSRRLVDVYPWIDQE